MVAGVSRRGGHLAISSNLAAWNGADRFRKRAIPGNGGFLVNIGKRKSEDVAVEPRFGLSAMRVEACHLDPYYEESHETIAGVKTAAGHTRHLEFIFGPVKRRHALALSVIFYPY